MPNPRQLALQIQINERASLKNFFVSKNNNKEYLANNENIEYEGSSAGGNLEFPNNKKIKSASKIANELYKRYNQEGRSISDKDHIKNLLDWY